MKFIRTTQMIFVLLLNMPTCFGWIDPSDLASSGAMLYSSTGVARTTSNPAFLTDLSQHQIFLGGSFNGPQLKNTDLTPTTVSASGMRPDSYQAAKAEHSYFGTMALGLRPHPRWAIGVAAKMSGQRLARLQSFTSDDSTYLQFDERGQKPEVYTAIGFRLLPTLSLGAGIYHSFKANGQIQLAASDTDADARMMIELLPDFIPYGSLAWKSSAEGPHWSLGVFYRAEGQSQSDIEIDTSFNITNAGSIPLSAGSGIVAFYDPELWALGLGRVQDGWQLHMSLELSKWSGYKAPIVSLSGRDLTKLTGGIVQYDQVSLKNTYRAALGGSIRLGPDLDSWKLFSGFGYEQSAMPELPTSLAVLDSEKWFVGMGPEKRFGLPTSWELSPVDLRIGVRMTELKAKNFTFTNKQAVTKTARVGGRVWEVALGGSLEF